MPANGVRRHSGGTVAGRARNLTLDAFRIPQTSTGRRTGPLTTGRPRLTWYVRVQAAAPPAATKGGALGARAESLLHCLAPLLPASSPRRTPAERTRGSRCRPPCSPHEGTPSNRDRPRTEQCIRCTRGQEQSVRSEIRVPQNLAGRDADDEPLKIASGWQGMPRERCSKLRQKSHSRTELVGVSGYRSGRAVAAERQPPSDGRGRRDDGQRRGSSSRGGAPSEPEPPRSPSVT